MASRINTNMTSNTAVRDFGSAFEETEARGSTKLEVQWHNA